MHEIDQLFSEGREGSARSDVTSSTVPGLRYWDLSAFKRLNVTERQQFEIRGEFFNAFNQAQFDSINSSNIGNIASPNFGIITATRDSCVIRFSARYRF